MISIVQRRFNLTALKPNIKTLELHRVLVHGQYQRRVGLSEKPKKGEEEYFAVLSDQPFIHEIQKRKYPRSYVIQKNCPFPAITTLSDLVNAFSAFKGETLKFRRTHTDEELLQFTKNLNAEAQIKIIFGVGEVFQIHHKGLYAHCTTSMIYISDDERIEPVNMGNATEIN